MKRILLGLTLALLLLGTPVVGAAYIDLQFQGQTGSVSVQRSLDYGANYSTALAGQFLFTNEGTTYTNLTDIYTFCVEPLEYTQSGIVRYDVAPLENAPTNYGPMGVTKANLLRELYGTYYTVNTPVATNIGAALQIATWEIVREESGVLGVTTGSTRFTGDVTVLNLAESYLQGITNNVGPMRYDIAAAINVGAQDPWIPNVPIPGAVWLLGSGLLGLVAIRRRFQK